MMHEVWVAKIMISVSIQKKLASTCFPRKRPLVWEVLKPWLSILQLARHPGIVARLGGRVEAAGCCLPQVSDMPWYGNSKENSHLVCVCVELLKRSKTCTRITLALFWQYINLFRGAALTSGFPHVHSFFVPVLAEKEFPYCNTILAGASGSSYLPDATKLWYDEGWVV